MITSFRLIYIDFLKLFFFILQMRQKEADHCNSSVIQCNNDTNINNTKMTTTTTNNIDKDSISDNNNQTKQTTATNDSKPQTNYDNKQDSFAMVRNFWFWCDVWFSIQADQKNMIIFYLVML